ncbi:disks large-associated protein 2 isoform X2 [Rhynchophorus ferrugineus]|uniref:disks large-associated protein 2 isoform X2 n=1 Tax=Rhynchophorus ferrugineus TaxID=354439 RepID=UPI003FCD9690
MGKKRRLNKLISKWIKSDLPEDRSSVLLLSVTRVPTSPKPQRRPFSLPLAFGVVSSCSKSPQVRRNSSSVSNGRRPSVVRRDPRRCVVVPATAATKGERLPIQTEAKDSTEKSNENGNVNGRSASIKPNGTHGTCISGVRKFFFHKTSREDIGRKSPESTLGRFKVSVVKPTDELNNARRSVNTDPATVVIPPPPPPPIISLTPEPLTCPRDDNMETSVDSIGTCSLDMDASTETQSDWSEVSSTGTLRSVRVLTPVPQEVQEVAREQHHLPSYLSLACTVNGYSTTTNYDPIRFARSRDASPHRLDPGNYLTGPQPTYSVSNNLLSPPNLVPLPTPKVNMTENILQTHHSQKFYSSTKTMTFTSKESHYSSNVYTKDTTDGCISNAHHTIQKQCISYENKSICDLPDQIQCSIKSSTISKEYTNGQETKSFIQQRVERLYGPGALAQGFFVSKRKQNRISGSDETAGDDVHNKTLPDKFLDNDNSESGMKQSSSSPSLPVLRHLRPEFRAQLPIASPKKTKEAIMQKSVTVPKLTDEVVKVNGHSKASEEVSVSAADRQNGKVIEVPIKEESSEKDGHYFIRILEEQTARLLELADKAENELNTPGLSEEVIGKLRSASGKARLLVSQKMQQFKGLCTNNITQSEGEAFPTTNEDLQGFWDMVKLQVDQVDKLFAEIDKLRENNWKEEIIKKVETKSNGAARPRKTVAKPKPSAANEEARKQREEQRKKMIEERRKAMKAQQSSKPSIEIFVPESS